MNSILYNLFRSHFGPSTARAHVSHSFCGRAMRLMKLGLASQHEAQAPRLVPARVPPWRQQQPRPPPRRLSPKIVQAKKRPRALRTPSRSPPRRSSTTAGLAEPTWCGEAEEPAQWMQAEPTWYGKDEEQAQAMQAEPAWGGEDEESPWEDGQAPAGSPPLRYPTPDRYTGYIYTRKQSGWKQLGRFSGVSQPSLAQDPLDRRGSPCSSTCTKNQPRRPILSPFRDGQELPPDCLQVKTQV